MKKAIGIDIGGTKVAFGLLDEKQELVSQLELASNPTDRQLMYEVVESGIKKILEMNQIHEEDVSFGIGVPGVVDSEKGIAVFQSNLPWENFPLAEKLRETFPGVARIKLDNDVVQAAFAEWQALRLTKRDSLVFLTVSTGVASPILIGGNPVRGEGVSGEIGLLPVWNPIMNRLERLEEAASGVAIAAYGKKLYQDPEMTTKEVFERYWQKDAIAVEIVESIVCSLAHGIYGIGCLLDPTKIVLGGSVVLKNPFILDLLKAKLSEMIIPVQSHLIDSLVLSQYDNTAGLVGAALSVAI